MSPSNTAEGCLRKCVLFNFVLKKTYQLRWTHFYGEITQEQNQPAAAAVEKHKNIGSKCGEKKLLVNPPNVTQEVIPRWKSWAHRTIVSWKPEYLEISLSPINEAPWVRQTNPDLKLTLHTTTIIIIITRSGMGLWGQDTVSRVHFWMFSTSRFAPLTLSSDLILLLKMWQTTDATSHVTHMLKWG